MIVYVFPADMHGCGFYRLIWPAAVLRAAGHDVRIIDPKKRGNHLEAYPDGHGGIADVSFPPDADVIVLQRITHVHLIRAIELMRAKGVAVVIDMDDDLASIPTQNPAFAAMHPRFGVSKEHNWHNTQRACEAATLVTVSTDALLARYAPHGRGRILRNHVPAAYLEVPHEDSDLVGWGGSVHSHPDDLQVVGNSLNRLIRQGARFRVVGPAQGVREALRLDEPVNATGPRELLGEWPRALGELGIGIAPLADNRFNVAKSWLKPLEKAAVGVPCVMSPRAEYRRIHELGIGLLAAKPKDWFRQLDALRSSESLRRDLSDRGRQVAGELTIENGAWRWVEAWADALKIERGGTSTTGYASPPPGDTDFTGPGINQRPVWLDRPRQTARPADLAALTRSIHRDTATVRAVHTSLSPPDAPPLVLGGAAPDSVPLGNAKSPVETLSPDGARGADPKS